MLLLLVPMDNRDRGGRGFSLGERGRRGLLILIPLLLELAVVDVVAVLLWLLLLWFLLQLLVLKGLAPALEGSSSVEVLGHRQAQRHSQYYLYNYFVMYLLLLFSSINWFYGYQWPNSTSGCGNVRTFLLKMKFGKNVFIKLNSSPLCLWIKL